MLAIQKNMQSMEDRLSGMFYALHKTLDINLMFLLFKRRHRRDKSFLKLPKPA